MYRAASIYYIMRLWLMLGIVCCGVSSCSQGGGKTLPTYEVTRMAYDDVLAIEGYTESLNSLTISCPPDVDGTIVRIVETGEKVKEGDVICIIEDAEIANNYDQWQLELESMHAEMEKLKASQELETALLEAQLRNNDVETLLAESDSLQMLYMSPKEREIKKLQLERARIERDQLIRKVEATKELQKTDVMKIERQIAKTERRLEDELKKIESLTLRAPRDGIAIRARRRPWGEETWNIGDNVWNGRAVIMMPDLEQMKILIYAQEADYKRIQQGDSVTYTFDAMPGNMGWGRIERLSPVGQMRTEGSSVKTFEIEATLDSLLMPVDPGLSVQCKVYLRHVPDTIVVPTISVFDKDSLKVVYVLHGGRFEERVVSLGESSPRSSIVASGLLPGEKISLIKPEGD